MPKSCLLASGELEEQGDARVLVLDPAHQPGRVRELVVSRRLAAQKDATPPAQAFANHAEERPAPPGREISTQNRALLTEGELPAERDRQEDELGRHLDLAAVAERRPFDRVARGAEPISEVSRLQEGRTRRVSDQEAIPGGGVDRQLGHRLSAPHRSRMTCSKNAGS